MPKKNPHRLKKRNRRIKERYEDGWLMEEIAEEFDLSVEMISKILGRPTKKLSTDEGG